MTVEGAPRPTFPTPPRPANPSRMAAPAQTSGLDFFPALKPAFALLLVCAAAQILFLVGLGQPNQMMFDETHYVPAARMLFTGAAYVNVEHPLLGKWLIGLSMHLFGDTPWGWRVLSTVAGTATVAAIFGIAQALWRDSRVSLVAATLAILNQLLFIQARIAMLDVYMGAFLLAALWLLLDAREREGRAVRWRLVLAGIAFGCAIGCKWAAVPYAGAAGLTYLVLRLRGRGWAGVSAAEGALLLAVPALAIYLATFTPAFFVGANPLAPRDLLVHQMELLRLQTQQLSPHPYESQWWSWPVIGRPIWYLYERVEGVMRGVLFIGNPAIMWGGLVAAVACLWTGLRRHDGALLLVAGLFLFSWLVFAVIPKKIGFYYYYYMPALFLCLALAGALHRLCTGRWTNWLPPVFLGVAAALFYYFYPVLAARPLADEGAFAHWTWLESWK